MKPTRDWNWNSSIRGIMMSEKYSMWWDSKWGSVWTHWCLRIHSCMNTLVFEDTFMYEHIGVVVVLVSNSAPSWSGESSACHPVIAINRTYSGISCAHLIWGNCGTEVIAINYSYRFPKSQGLGNYIVVCVHWLQSVNLASRCEVGDRMSHFSQRHDTAICFVIYMHVHVYEWASACSINWNSKLFSLVLFN